jgi:hypothetical protein
MENMEPPREVLEAAILVNRYFSEKGISHWELFDVCSRTFAFRALNAENKLDEIKNILG